MKLPDELQFLVNARKTQKTTDARLDGQFCIITGATSGVGYQTAKRFAKGGANLALVCRNMPKAAKVKNDLEGEYGVQVDLVKADFTRFSEVRGAAQNLLENHTRVDVLVNNAGLHNTHRKITEEGHETVFCVNHLAPFLLTGLLINRLLESAPARIINVSSQGHRFGGLDIKDLDWSRRRYNGYRGYGASKTAQLLTTWEFADRLKGTGVTINAVHPGAVRTNIGMNNGLLFQWYQRIFIWPFLKDPEISGEAVYFLAAAPEMGSVSGRFFNQTVHEKPAPHALDRSLGKQVWEISERLTGLPGLKI